MSRQEIEDYFETFGQPHVEDNQRKFGRFRMGRSQVMAFAETDWRSNQFAMHVDNQGMGLDYQLTEEPHYAVNQTGCSITGRWYKPLGIYELADLEKDLKEHFLYLFALDVMLNGKRITYRLDEIKITHQTEERYYLQQSESLILAVYNLGVLVRTDYYDYSGVTGVIVSKKNLKLDISRQWISRECPIWLQIQTFLEQAFPRVNRLLASRRPLTVREIDLAYQCIRENLITSDELWSIRLFRTQHNTGRFSLNELLTGTTGFTFVAPGQEAIADQAGQQGLVRMLSAEGLSHYFPATDHEGVITRFLQQISRLSGHRAGEELLMKLNRYYLSFEVATRSVSRDEVLLDEATLSLKDRCAVKAIRSAYIATLSRAWQYSCFHSVRNRKFVIGRSTTASGWTDVRSFVALNQNLLRRLDKGIVHCDFVAAVIVHEWCHTDDNPSEHNAEFYRRFHRLTVDLPLNLITNFSRSINRHYACYLLQAGLPVPKAVDKEINGGASRFYELDQLYKQQQVRCQGVERERFNLLLAVYDLFLYVDTQSMIDDLPPTLTEFVNQYKSQDSLFKQAAQHRKIRP